MLVKCASPAIEEERELLWKGRKNAFGALGRMAPSNYVIDGVIPSSKIPQAFRRIKEIGEQYNFEIGNIFHAGDGNLHPIVFYDPRNGGPISTGHCRLQRKLFAIAWKLAGPSPGSTAWAWRKAN